MWISTTEWAEKHFYYDRTSTVQGRFRVSHAGAWIRDLFDAWDDPTVISGTTRCSAQSGKTVLGQVFAAKALAEDPGPIMWTLPAQDECKTFSKTRLADIIERCAPLQRLLPAGRYDKTNLEINFAASPLILVGAGSGSKVSGKPISRLLIDEEKDYDPGAVDKVLMRVRSKWDSKIWRMSTPDHEGDSIDQAFHNGDQRYWHVKCPNCQEEHYLRWGTRDSPGGMKCHADGLRIKALWYECPTPGCGHKWYDTPVDRSYIANKGVWVRHNVLSDPGDRSWTWNAILPLWNSWHKLMLEFLKAMMALKGGDKQPLRVFRNETACDPWNESYAQEKVEIHVTNTYSVKDFENGEKIDHEYIRFATIDRGLDHQWLCIRAWRVDGSSRLLFYRQMLMLAETTEAIVRYKVEPQHVFQDCGFHTDDVYAECSDHGWFAVAGLAGVESFRHPVRNRAGVVTSHVEKPFSQIIFADAGKGKYRARRVNLASQRLKDITAHLRSGAGELWEVPHDIPQIYLNQLVREHKEEKRNPRTGAMEPRWQEGVKGNHAWDCEYYQVGCAIIAGLPTLTRE